MKYGCFGDTDRHLVQNIDICYLLPIDAAQHASTTPRGNLTSRLFLNDRINEYGTTVKLLANIL
jgi:hypothetical protein